MNGVRNKRVIPLEKASNVRDLGGYLTADGQKTSDIFIRGDSAEILSEHDKSVLLNTGLRTVIDLRSSIEIERAPSVFEHCPQTEYYQISILPEVSRNDFVRQSGYTFFISDVYIAILERSQDKLCQLFRIMTEAEGKVFFHCNAGKDRSGVVAALLLKLANIDDQTVIEDYCLTETFLGDKLVAMKEATRQAGDVPENLVEELMGIKSSTMEKFLTHLQNNWKSAEAYLLSTGLSDTEITTLKRKMIQRP